MWQFLAVDAYNKNKKRSQINNFPFHLKELEREEQTESKARRIISLK